MQLFARLFNGLSSLETSCVCDPFLCSSSCRLINEFLLANFAGYAFDFFPVSLPALLSSQLAKLCLSKVDNMTTTAFHRLPTTVYRQPSLVIWPVPSMWVLHRLVDVFAHKSELQKSAVALFTIHWATEPLQLQLPTVGLHNEWLTGQKGPPLVSPLYPPRKNCSPPVLDYVGIEGHFDWLKWSAGPDIYTYIQPKGRTDCLLRAHEVGSIIDGSSEVQTHHKVNVRSLPVTPIIKSSYN